MGNLPHLLLHLLLGEAPALGAQLVDFRLLVGQAFILADQVEAVDGQVEFVAVPVFNQHEIIGHVLDVNGFQSLVDAQAVVAVDDDIPVAQLGKTDGISFLPAGLFLASQPHFTKQFTVGEKVKFLVRDGEAVGQRMTAEQ